jgi:hypothetical protein
VSDFISRKEAVDRITDGYQNSDGGQDRYAVGINVGLTKALNALKDVPSAEPERKTGIWMGSVCSECGNSTSFYYDCDYCPKCGAKMRGEHETD